MTNDRIEQWLTRAANLLTVSPNLLTAGEAEAFEILRFLAGPDGAIRIADDAAWEIVAAECRAVQCDAEVWWVTAEHEPPIDLDPYVQASVAAATRYLLARGLAIQHPTKPTYLRAESDDLPPDCTGDQPTNPAIAQ